MSRIAEVTAKRTYVIAEIGANHGGDIAIAKDLIAMAAEAGVDCVKGQKRHMPSLFTEEELAAPYTGPHSYGATYGEHRAALELTIEQHAELMEYAFTLGVEYSLSAWDPVSVAECAAIDVPWIKVPSACVTSLPTLTAIASTGLPVILSTGMSTTAEIDAAVEVLSSVDELYLLACTSSYPCEFADVHLRRMHTLRARYQRPVGVSGHWRGIAVDVAAVGLGAFIVERHVTLDRTWKGTDHAASLEPHGLATLVRDIRAAEAAMGGSELRRLPVEESAHRKLRTAKLRGVA